MENILIFFHLAVIFYFIAESQFYGANKRFWGPSDGVSLINNIYKYVVQQIYCITSKGLC